MTRFNFAIETKILGICTILLMACAKTNAPPDYVLSLPLYEPARYVEAPEWEMGQYTDTLIFDTWFDSEKLNITDPDIRFAKDVQKVGENYWIADVIGGAIYAYDSLGLYTTTIARRGRGPNEVLKPASVSSVPGTLLISVLDIEAKSIIVYDHSGKEKKRLQQKAIDSFFPFSKIVSTIDNGYLLKKASFSDHLIANTDSTGKIVRSFVEPVVPVGGTNQVYNEVIYDWQNEGESLAYAYNGLPVIYSRFDNQLYLINLFPKKELSEFNVPLNSRKEQAFTADIEKLKGAGVQGVIIDLYIYENKIFMLYKNSILVITPKGDSIRKYIPIDSEGNKIKGVGNISLKGKELFLINRFQGKIYKMNLENFRFDR